MKLIFLFFLTFPFGAWSQSDQKSRSQSDLKTQSQSADKALQKSFELKLDQDPQWLNLLHDHESFLFFKDSQATGKNFFLASRRGWTPKEELKSLIQAIFDPNFSRKLSEQALPEKAQCLFPGRFLYLQNKLGSEIPWPHVFCQRFEDFKKILSAKSATYVFSSYYLNNPASGFGHSFLRINRGDQSRSDKRYELIDFGVGFAAVPTTSNPVFYSLMGVMGLFYGRFDVNPYYYKVREYNNFESRDLWEYDLNLSQESIDILVAHIFELGSADFPYYYFTQNCSYRILAVLDAADPSLHLVDRTKLAVMPGDTVQIIAQTPNLVKSRKYRASGRALFETRYNDLNENEKQKIKDFSKNQNLDKLLKDQNEKEKRDLLDTSIDYVDFRYADDILKNKGKDSLKKEILIKRSEISLSSEELVVPTPVLEAPDEAHGSARWTFGYKSFAGIAAEKLGYRFALHDLLDPLEGYPATTQLEMMGFEGSYRNDSRGFSFDSFKFLEIISMSPWTFYNKALSWQLRVGLFKDYQNNCNDCLPAVISGGVGITQKVLDQFLISELVKFSFSYSDAFYTDKWVGGAGPALRIRHNLGARWATLTEISYRYDYKAFNSDFREVSLATQYDFSKFLGFRLSAVSDNKYFIDLNYYY